jgi:exosortase
MTAALDTDWRGRMGVGAVRWPSVAFWAGFATLLIPTLIENYRQSWSSEQGQHGPIVLALGLWLVWRRWGAMRAAAQPPSVTVAIGAGVLCALAYLAGRIADQFLLESYAVYGFALVAVYAQFGAGGLKTGWFPLAFLLFALPAPYMVTWALTSHLRLWVTEAAVVTWRLFGVSIVRDGLNILVDQYDLAVQEACSGMNSLISLSAIGLIYIHIRRSPPWWYYAVMALPIIGFAVFGNFVRVCVLIALTHFFGDAVAQSYLHETAGLVTFVTALLGVIGLDAVLGPALMRTEARR